MRDNVMLNLQLVKKKKLSGLYCRDLGLFGGFDAWLTVSAVLRTTKFRWWQQQNIYLCLGHPTL